MQRSCFHLLRTSTLLFFGIGIGLSLACSTPPRKSNRSTVGAGRAIAQPAVIPPIPVLLQFAIDETKAGNFDAALKAVEHLFQAGQPNRLEAWVLVAEIGERNNDASMSKQAWARVEEINRRKGKIRAFTDPITLLSAGMRYLKQKDEKSAAPFVEELIRRYPKHAAAPLAQRTIVQVAIAAGHWQSAARSCELLQRRWPNHARSCAPLKLRSRRLLELGPPAAKDAPRWSWQNPLPQGNSLRAVWVAKDGTAFAVGDRGAIVFRSSRSRNFEQMDSPTRWNLRAIFGRSKTDVVAVGEGGIILRWKGKRWQVARPADSKHADLNGVSVAGSGEIVAVGEGGIVVTGTTGKWKRRSVIKHDLFDVWATGEKAELWAAGANGVLLRYHLGNWSSVKNEAEEDFLGVVAFGGQRVRAVGTGRALLRMDGRRQDLRPVGKYDLHDIWAESPGHFWTVGKKGTTIEFNGQSWTYRASPTLVDLFSIHGRRGGLITVGQGGTALERTKKRWKLLSGGQRAEFVSIRFTEKGEPWALDARGGLWTRKKEKWFRRWSAPAGRYAAMAIVSTGFVLVGDRAVKVDKNFRSRRIAIGAAEELLAVSHQGEKTLAVGSRGGIYVLDGRSFVSIGSPTALRLTGLSQHGGTAIAVGRRGTVLHRRGSKWVRETTHALEDLRAVQVFADKRAVAVGKSGRVLLRNGTRWTFLPKPAEQNLVAVWGRSADDFYVASENGGIYYYRGQNGRGKWQVQRSPAACLRGIEGNASSGEVLAFGCFGAVLRLTHR